jgi:catechol 2,3-dioxygenase-like lactoylglutathione lyase family enzyme
MPPQTDGILETSLYVDDLTRSAEFYLRVFGFPVIAAFPDARGCALQAGPRQVLLLFRKGASRTITSPHDGDGELHLAFAIPAHALSAWEAWLAENSLPVEERHEWERGGVSLYFRDPDRHLLEVVTPGLWTIY